MLSSLSTLRKIVLEAFSSETVSTLENKKYLKWSFKIEVTFEKIY